MTEEFNPDTYLAQGKEAYPSKEEPPFDPDAYLGEASPKKEAASTDDWMYTDSKDEGEKNLGRKATTEGIAAAKVVGQLPSYAVSIGGRLLAAADWATGAKGDPMADAEKRWEQISKDHPYLTDPVGTILKDLTDVGDVKEGVDKDSDIAAGFATVGKGLKQISTTVTDVTGSEALGSLASLGTETALLGAGKGVKAVGRELKPVVSSVAGKLKEGVFPPKEKPLTPEEEAKKENFQRTKQQEGESVAAVMERKREADKQALIDSPPEELQKLSTRTAYTKAQEIKKQHYEDTGTGMSDSSFRKVYEEEKGKAHEVLLAHVESLKRPRVAVDKHDLVETAFRNKQTGEVTNTGAKHPEQLKEVTKDSHDQGFVDGNGKFLPRQEATIRAKATGQLPEDHVLEKPEDGLHSGDLRTAGDKDFGLPKENSVEKRSSAGIEDPKEKQAVEDAIRLDEQNHPMAKATSDIVFDAEGDVRVANNDSTRFRNQLEKALPGESGIKSRTRITRALEADKDTDKLLTKSEFNDRISGLERSRNKLASQLQKAKGELPSSEAEHSHLQEIQFLLEERLQGVEYAHKELLSRGPEDHLIPIKEAVEARFKANGEQAKKAGLVDSLVDNYVTHLLDFSKTKMTPTEIQKYLSDILKAPSTRSLKQDHTIERTYKTIRELEQAVKGTGIVVETDIAKIVEKYEHSLQTAIIWKKATDTLKGRNGIDGKPLIVDYTVAPSAREGYSGFSGKGSDPLKNYYVHPDIAPDLAMIFLQKDPSRFMKALSGITGAIKSSNVVASLFHAYNLGIAAANTGPSILLKAAFSKEGGMKASLDAFRLGLGENAHLLDLGQQQGLMLGKIAREADYNTGIVSILGNSIDAGLSKLGPEVKLARHATDPYDKYIQKNMDHLTWEFLHTGLKSHFFIEKFNKAKIDRPEIPDAELAKQVASHINNSFGGLNWGRVAADTSNQFFKSMYQKAASKDAMPITQLFLFAPDWTASTLRAVTQGIPKSLDVSGGVKGVWKPKNSADFSRRYALTAAVTYLTIQNAINNVSSGHNIWDNQDPTRMELDDGTSVQLAKHSAEPFEWLLHPLKTAGNKTAFLPKSTAILLTGQQYMGGPKLKNDTTGNRILQVAKQALPFSVSSAMNAPEGEGLQRGLLSAAGINIYGHMKDSALTEDELVLRKLGRQEQRLENEAKKFDIDVEEYKNYTPAQRKQVKAQLKAQVLNK